MITASRLPCLYCCYDDYHCYKNNSTSATFVVMKAIAAISITATDQTVVNYFTTAAGM